MSGGASSSEGYQGGGLIPSLALQVEGDEAPPNDEQQGRGSLISLALQVGISVAPPDPPKQSSQQQVIQTFFACPVCEHKLDASKSAFCSSMLHHRIWCNSCKRQRFVRLWQCACRIPWHTCTRHSSEPERIRQYRPPIRTRTSHAPQPIAQRRMATDSSTADWLRQRPPPAALAPLEISFSVAEVATAAGQIANRVV